MFIKTNQDVFTLLGIKGTKPQELCKCVWWVCVYTQNEAKSILIPSMNYGFLYLLLRDPSNSYPCLLYILSTHTLLLFSSLSLYIYSYFLTVSQTHRFVNAWNCLVSSVITLSLYYIYIFWLMERSQQSVSVDKSHIVYVIDIYLFFYYFFFNFN